MREDDTDETKHEKLIMQSDSKGFIYYIVNRNNESHIMEGNPRDPRQKNHYPIFSIKTTKLLAFAHEEGVFYIMDPKHVVYKLTRSENQRQLNIEKETTLKEIQKLDFKPKDHSTLILRDNYSVLLSKIYYFFDVEANPWPTGIMEAEQLISEEGLRETVSLVKGPIQFQGSNRFYNAFRKDRFQTFIRIFSLPNKT